MSDAAYIEQTSDWARWLTQREVRGPGDMDGAWRRLERRYGIPRGVFWRLRYRRPKTISVSIYAKLKFAIEVERERQFKLLQHEITLTKATSWASDHSVVEVEALVGAAQALVGGASNSEAGETEIPKFLTLNSEDKQ